MNIQTILFACCVTLCTAFGHLASAAPPTASSTRGGVGGGGGDLECDAQIRKYSTNIGAWIKLGGAYKGPKKLDLSSSLNPQTQQAFTFTDYTNGMSPLFLEALHSGCVSPGDSRYPLQIGKAPKVCITNEEDDGIHMLCQTDRFMKMNPDKQIQQIHHEFAILVPGLEPDDGDISTYQISSQLSAFTKTMPETMLVVLTNYSQIQPASGLYSAVGVYACKEQLEFDESNNSFLLAFPNPCQLAGMVFQFKPSGQDQFASPNERTLGHADLDNCAANYQSDNRCVEVYYDQKTGELLVKPGDKLVYTLTIRALNDHSFEQATTSVLMRGQAVISKFTSPEILYTKF
jgi:hypothetical protein